jgi:hypothetical protein
MPAKCPPRLPIQRFSEKGSEVRAVVSQLAQAAVAISEILPLPQCDGSALGRKPPVLRVAGPCSLPADRQSIQRNERAPRSLVPELRLGVSHAANDGSHCQLVSGFVERQLQAADVAPVDTFWLRRIAVMRDLSLASRTFPWHSCTGPIECRNSGAAGSLPSLRCDGMSCAKAQAMTAHPSPLPPCPRCHRLTGG